VRAAIRHLVHLAAGLGLLLFNADAMIVQQALPADPLVGRPPILGATLVAEADGARRLGDCWWTTHRGQHVLYVKGDAFTLGYCNSRLAGEVMGRQEQALHDALDTFVPYRALQHLLVRGVMWVYRGMPAHFTESERREVAGIAAGYADPFRHKGPTYPRILSYHAIHDISQALIDNPLLACTAFAASGGATTEGQTLLARNFDFEGGRVFDEDKVVLFYDPEHGVPFVSVVWAGMVGAVSGMNAEGVAIALNAAGSDDLSTSGAPTTLLVRQVLQHARSLDDAIALLSAREVFVTDIFTVADGETGEVAVIERTPARIHVRRTEGVARATNHLLEAAFGDDEENAKRAAEGTTSARLERLDRLLEAANGRLDTREATAILRDRRIGDGEEVGLGHRGAIDALIAAHSVVFDASARRLWVSTPPHTLGEFVEYDLEAVLSGRLEDRGALPADPLLADGGWRRLVDARRAVAEGTALLADDPAAARRAAERALELAPDHPPALRLRGDACHAVGEACARDAYSRYLDSHPPYARHARRVEARLGR